MKKHPELAKVAKPWERIRTLVEEDEDKYPDFMLTLPNESAQAKLDRCDTFRTGFVNPTTSLIRAKGDSIYQKPVIRQKLTPSQEKFVEKADKSGQSFQDMMHAEVAPMLAAYGNVFAVIDKPSVVVSSKAEQLDAGMPYMTILDASQLIDFEWGDDGELLWVAYAVAAPMDRREPTAIKSEWGRDTAGIAIWTRTQYMVKSTGGKKDLQDAKPNPFGFVPVIFQAQFVAPNKTIGRSTFFAGSLYLITANNLAAASNGEVYKNSSATLTMQEQDYSDDTILHPTNPETNLKQVLKQTHEVKNVLLFQKDRPEYLVRDLDLIELAAGRAEKYFELAEENEKASLSPDSLQAPESGVAKSYTFSDANKMLAGFAYSLQSFEKQALRMVAKANGEESGNEIVIYSRDYDVRDFNARIAFVKGLRGAGYNSETGMKEAMKAITVDITSNPELQETINNEIDAAKPEPEPNPGETNKPGAFAGKGV